MMPMKTLWRLMNIIFVGLIAYFGIFWYINLSREKALSRIIENLKSETRVAEALVTDSHKDILSGRVRTTIKFLEYGINGKPLKARHFTFDGSIIQFQTLVVRFEDVYVEKRDRARGRSICLFMKAFCLNGDKTQEFEITKASATPDGYRIDGSPTLFQDEIWGRFWRYVLDPDERMRLGIKNAQIEAPGSLFVPGTIYTIKIEHDGGVRIDTRPIPPILRGERIA